jgi:hypothetical protein
MTCYPRRVCASADQAGADHLWNQQACYRNVYRPAVATVGAALGPVHRRALP